MIFLNTQSNVLQEKKANQSLEVHRVIKMAFFKLLFVLTAAAAAVAAPAYQNLDEKKW